VIEKGLDTLLQVFVVRCREALDRAHQAGHVAEGAAGFAAEEFEAVYTMIRES
jgi:hypothetical protein